MFSAVIAGNLYTSPASTKCFGRRPAFANRESLRHHDLSRRLRKLQHNDRSSKDILQVVWPQLLIDSSVSSTSTPLFRKGRIFSASTERIPLRETCTYDCVRSPLSFQRFFEEGKVKTQNAGVPLREENGSLEVVLAADHQGSIAVGARLAQHQFSDRS